MELVNYLNPERFEEVLTLFNTPKLFYMGEKYLKGCMFNRREAVEHRDILEVSIYSESSNAGYIGFTVEYDSNLNSHTLVEAYYSSKDSWVHFPHFKEYYNSSN